MARHRFPSQTLVLALLASAASAEVVCTLDQATLSVAALQRARGRLSQPGLRTAGSREDCAKKLVESVDQTPVDGCSAGCLRELVGVYTDAALKIRQALLASNNPGNRVLYAKDEIGVRTRLHEKLKNEAKQIDPSGAELRRNFGELADVYELLDDPRSYHQMISSDAARAALGPKAFGVWAKALRSCSEWKFLAGSNRDSPQLIRALCDESCRPELEKLEATLPNTTQEVRETVVNLVPAVAKCPGQP